MVSTEATNARSPIQEIDVGDRRRDVTVDHHTAVEQAVNQIDERNLTRVPGAVEIGDAARLGHRAASIDP